MAKNSVINSTKVEKEHITIRKKCSLYYLGLDMRNLATMYSLQVCLKLLALMNLILKDSKHLTEKMKS
jgi:hypothetical protein